MLDTNSNQGSLGNLVVGASKSPITYPDALENYRRNMDWWIVFETLDLPHAIGSSLWISERTGISVEATAEALEGLSVLGLLKQSEKGFEKIKKDFDIPWTDKPKTEKLADHVLISQQILNHLDESARGAMRFASFATNIEMINEIYQKIDKILIEAKAKSEKLSASQLDNVYLFSYTSVNGTPFSSNGKEESHA